MKSCALWRIIRNSLRLALGLLVVTAVAAIGFAQELPKPPAGEYPETLPRRSAPISQAPSNGASLHSLVLGGVRVTTIYVDTGPFAAAEEHTCRTPAGSRQYVVVRVRSHVIATYELASTVVKLQTDVGAAYNPLGPNGREEAAALPRGDGVSEMVFKTGANENPAFLIVQNPNPGDTVCGPGCFPERKLIRDFELYRVSPSPNCPGGCEPVWRKLGTDQVALSLAGLPSIHDIGETPQHSAPLRLGQLEIRVTSVGLASGDWDGLRFLTEHDHHEVVVSLAVRNVSRHPVSDCTGLNGNNFRLYDSRGFEYRAGIRSEPMGVTSLLPGEGTGGLCSSKFGTEPPQGFSSSAGAPPRGHARRCHGSGPNHWRAGISYCIQRPQVEAEPFNHGSRVVPSNARPDRLRADLFPRSPREGRRVAKDAGPATP